MQSGEQRSPPDGGANPMLLRVRAAEATLQQFMGKPFAWGRADCLRLAAFHLRELGCAPPLREAGEYRTLLGAHRALKRTGHATFEAWVDSWGLMRIPPALALPGDLLGFRTEEDGWHALSVALSNGRALGFYGDPPLAQVVQPVDVAAAWSVA